MELALVIEKSISNKRFETIKLYVKTKKEFMEEERGKSLIININEIENINKNEIEEIFKLFGIKHSFFKNDPKKFDKELKFEITKLLGDHYCPIGKQGDYLAYSAKIIK